MTIKELEIKRAEEFIVKQLPPIAKSFILNSPRVNKTIEKYEDIILSFMNENGSINGKMLNSFLLEKYPNITNWINVPNEDFYLIAFIN